MIARVAADVDEPLFQPLRHSGKRRDKRRRIDPDAIDRVVRKCASELGLAKPGRGTAREIAP